jgi:hypothetical protein
VRLGEWDTSKADELAPHQDVPVIDSVIHEGFYAAAVHNDFALLYLAEPANLGGHIDTICLPTPEQLFDPAKCLVAGWGKDKFGKILFQISIEFVALMRLLNNRKGGKISTDLEEAANPDCSS